MSENGTICIFVKKVGGWKGQAMATSTTRMLSSSWLNFRCCRWWHKMSFVFSLSYYPLSHISNVCTDVNHLYVRQLQIFQKVESGGGPCNAMQYHAIPGNTMKYHAIPCNASNTMQYNEIPCSTMHNHAIPCSTIQYHSIPYNCMQYNAIPCNTVLYNAIPCSTMQYHAIPCKTMQYHAILCNTM